MILWTIKLLSTAKKAIAGRKHPHQLAWAVAFGVLLGIVPHGNLLAVGLVVLVVSLKLNHAMAALTAVATTFLIAAPLDPISHQVGDFVLTHPEITPIAMSAWRLPLVPWTDLNNTVVMGSLLVGTAALIPLFVVTYPLFRLFAPAADREAVDFQPAASPIDVRPSQTEGDDRASRQVALIDRGHPVAGPHTDASQPSTADNLAAAAAAGEDQPQVAVQTRIDVIRMKGERSPDTDAADHQPDPTDQPPMDEALNYLLRQLRDSQPRSAA